MKKVLLVLAVILVLAMILPACNITVTPGTTQTTETTTTTGTPTPDEPKEDVVEIIDGYIWVNGVNTGIKAYDGKEDEKPDDEEPKEDVIEIIDGYIWVNGVNTGIKAETCDHVWNTVTVEPTCTEGGYDIMICALCQKSAIVNKTEKLEHVYSATYTIDDEYHWLKCEGCEDIQGKEYHSLDDEGICTVCSMPISETPGIIYDISADGTYAEVIGYEGTSKKVKIASVYKGLPVRNIYKEAFYYNHLITHVVIPDSVTSIGYRAFATCIDLTSVVLGKNVISIGEAAFECCYDLVNMVIPDSVTSIGANAFNASSKLQFNEYEGIKYLGSKDNPYFALIGVNNKNLSSYTIHEDTKIIADYAFSSCARLVSVTIPDGVTSIGDYAFHACSALESVVIGDGVTNIGERAFLNCSALKDVYYKGSEEDWAKIEIGTVNSNLTDATRHYNYVPEE